MNEIVEWIKNGRDFDAGASLYHKYGTNNSLKNRLTQRGKDLYNINILKIELPKLKYKAGKIETLPPEVSVVVEEKAKVRTIEELTADIKKLMANVEVQHPDLKTVLAEHKKEEDLFKMKNIRSSFHMQLMKVANQLTNQSLSKTEAEILMDEGEYWSYKIKAQTAKMNNKTIAPLRKKKVDPDAIDVSKISSLEEATKHLSNAMRRRTDTRNKVKKKLGSKRNTRWATIEKNVRNDQKGMFKTEFDLLDRREKLINELRIKIQDLSEV